MRLVDTSTIRSHAVQATGQTACLGFTRLLPGLEKSLGLHAGQRHVDRAALEPAVRAIHEIKAETLVIAEQDDDQGLQCRY